MESVADEPIELLKRQFLSFFDHQGFVAGEDVGDFVAVGATYQLGVRFGDRPGSQSVEGVR